VDGAVLRVFEYDGPQWEDRWMGRIHANGTITLPKMPSGLILSGCGYERNPVLTYEPE
jgi:hypothetical protein